VVTDPGISASGLLDRLLRLLEAHSLGFAVYDQVSPNPSTAVIERGEDVRAAEGCDSIIGFGGGSSLDTAKGVGVLSTSGGRLLDYAGVGKVTVAPATVLAIPTTAGTGAELSTAIAVTNESSHSKFAIRAPLVSPDVAILDPTLLATLPRRVAVDTTMDTLCHLIEAYVSKGATPLTDLLALEGVRRCGKWLIAFVADRANPDAAESMLYAAMLGGIVISHARTGGAHTLTRPLGDTVSHGLANAIVLPYIMRYNLPAAGPKFIEVARALGSAVTDGGLAGAEEAVAAVRRLGRELGVPRRLRDTGLREDRIPELARAAFELEISRLNPQELTERDIEKLLRDAY
jgi:alcohol dehydrogenase class IV